MNYIKLSEESQYVPGIYKIESKCGKIYIGSAICLRRRFCTHRWNLRNGIHVNPIIQRYYNKHGEDSLSFVVIELCTKENLIVREQYYINTVNPFFNINKIAGSRFGEKVSDATKLKMSISRKKALLNPELIERIRAASTGRKQTDRCKKILSALRKGVKRPQYNGGNNPKAKICVNIETGQMVSNTSELAKMIGHSRQHITNQLSGRRINNTKWIYATN